MHAPATFGILASSAAGTAEPTGAIAASAAAAANSSGGGGSVPALIAFGLLVASLIVFIVSTRQWPLLQRALIWGLGVLLLGLSALVWRSELQEIKQAVKDADALFETGDNLVAVAFGENFVVIQDYLILLFGVYVALATLIGLAALIAFTPGEAVEKAMRPVGVLILGGIAGSAIALFVVAVGTGQYPPRHFFHGHVGAITDGDTFKLGGLSIRPLGADAPEIDQKCLVKGIIIDCGDAAKKYLESTVRQQFVACVHVPGKKDFRGRELAQCKIVKGENAGEDIAALLVKSGNAIIFGNAFEREQEAARARGDGIWAGCFHRPKTWREAKTQAAKDQLVNALTEKGRAAPDVLCGPEAQ